jgi:hypothetical protein
MTNKKGLISRTGKAFDLLQALAEHGAVKYRELRERLGNEHLFDLTFYRLYSLAYVQVFVREDEPKRSARYLAITSKGLAAFELAEARKAKRVERVQQFIKLNNAHSPVNL